MPRALVCSPSRAPGLPTCHKTCLSCKLGTSCAILMPIFMRMYPEVAQSRNAVHGAAQNAYCEKWGPRVGPSTRTNARGLSVEGGISPFPRGDTRLALLLAEHRHAHAYLLSWSPGL